MVAARPVAISHRPVKRLVVRMLIDHSAPINTARRKLDDQELEEGVRYGDRRFARISDPFNRIFIKDGSRHDPDVADHVRERCGIGLKMQPRPLIKAGRLGRCVGEDVSVARRLWTDPLGVI